MSADRTPWTQKPRYSDLFFRLSDPALLLNPSDHSILDANDATEQALGASRDQLLESSIHDWLPEGSIEEFSQQVRIAMRRYHPREIEFRLKTAKNGSQTRLYRLSFCQLQAEESETIVQILGRDITEERLAQEKNEAYLRELQDLNQKLERLSTTDEMTQIANFRFFKQRVAEEHQRSIRFKRPYSILFFDLDHFKSYNDRNGHPAGDQLLRDFATLLKAQSRETDLLARYGGEEFVILATETTAQNAIIFAERIRTLVASHPFLNGQNQPLGHVSASIGVASYPEHGDSPEAVLKAADEAVYASKKSGRDRVTLAVAADS
jgi:diguanylate cyclase (GGDEF)-like protein/PAS domain S-box-containing protein